MESNGIQTSIGALNITTGNLRAAQAIYENTSSGRKQATGNDSRSRVSKEPYTVTISSRGQQMAKADFKREQQRETADFNRKEQQEEADFNREQMRAKADFQRQERQKETEFSQAQQLDAVNFEQNQRQKEAGFQRQLSLNINQDVNQQEP